MVDHWAESSLTSFPHAAFATQHELCAVCEIIMYSVISKSSPLCSLLTFMTISNHLLLLFLVKKTSLKKNKNTHSEFQYVQSAGEPLSGFYDSFWQGE